MAEVGLIRQLFSCKLNFFRINNNDKITRINMRCIRRLIFTAKDLGNLYCETANRLTFSVYNIPFAFDIGCVRHERRLHASFPPSISQFHIMAMLLCVPPGLMETQARNIT